MILGMKAKPVREYIFVGPRQISYEISLSLSLSLVFLLFLLT